MPKRSDPVSAVLDAYRALGPEDRQRFAEALAVEDNLPPPLAGLWMTCADAGRLLRKSRAAIWRATAAGRLVTNGKDGADKRVRFDSFLAVLRSIDTEKECAPERAARAHRDEVRRIDHDRSRTAETGPAVTRPEQPSTPAPDTPPPPIYYDEHGEGFMFGAPDRG
jgi:hypothetical protein